MPRLFSTNVPFAPAINIAYLKSWHGVESPTYHVYPVPSFYRRFNCLSTILIMPSLSYNPTTIKALIILGYSYTRLVVRSKPIRLNIRLESTNISRIISILRAI